MKRNSLLVVVFLTGIILLAACGGGESVDAAAKPVELYLQALVAQDTDMIPNVTCSEWEDQAILELDAFMGVEASLDEVSCQVSGEDGDSKLVQCAGNILATYNNEQQELSLAGRTYKVIQEGGEWRVCGYH